MSAMYRLKAYFGMVPAGGDGRLRRGDGGRPVRRDPPRHRGDVRRGPLGRPLRRRPIERRGPSADDELGPPPGRSTRPSTRAHDREPARTGRARCAAAASGTTATRGSLAIDTDPREPGPARPLTVASPAPGAAATRCSAPQALARITTLQPSSYNEARTIGERYRDGQPVIMNLTDLDDAAAKRLVDFAAGLAFALRGSIDKVTSRVFLLTPADVEVSADDARKLAERSVSGARVDAGRSFARDPGGGTRNLPPGLRCVSRHPVRPLLRLVLLLAAADRTDRGGARTQFRPPVGPRRDRARWPWS